MGLLVLSGSLAANAPSVTGDSFPSASAAVPFDVQRPYNVATGVLPRAVATIGSAWQTLDGVGATAAVTQGDCIYLRTEGELAIRFTTDDGVGGSEVNIVRVQGLCIREFPATKFLKLLEAQGTGRLEYLITGQS